MAWVGGLKLDNMLYRDYEDPHFFKNNLKEITIEQAKSNLNKGTPDHSRWVREKIFKFFKSHIGEEVDVEKLAGYKFEQTERSNIIRNTRVRLAEHGLILEKMKKKDGVCKYKCMKGKGNDGQKI